MDKKVSCHILDSTFQVELLKGESLDFAIKYLIDKCGISSSQRLICTLVPPEDSFSQIITQIPLVVVPDHLYFSIVSEEEHYRWFKRITVVDESYEYPSLQLLISNTSTIKDLETIFMRMKGHPKGLEIVFSDADKERFEEYPADWKISRFPQGEVELVAKKKTVFVVIESDKILGRLEIKTRNFTQTARVIFQKHRKYLNLDQTTNMNNALIFFQYKGKKYSPRQTINPQYQSEVFVKITNGPSKTETFQILQFQGKEENIRDMNKGFKEEQPSISTQPSGIKGGNEHQDKAIRQCSKAVHSMLIFKETKRLLRQAFDLPQSQQQDKQIKDIISLSLRAHLS